MSDPPEASRTRPILFVATVLVALLVVGLAAAATPAAASDAGDEEITAEVTGETYFGSQANEVTVTHTYSEDTDLDVSVPGKASAEDVAGEDEIVLDLGGLFYGAQYPVTVVAEVDGQTYRATLEEKGQPVTLEPVEAAEFDSASAEVTRVNYFGEAKKISFTYQAPEGSTVQFQAGSRTVTETADGTETTERVRVGSFFYGPDFPVEVSASIVGGQSVSGEIPDRRTEVVLVEEDDRTLESIELELDQNELEVGDTTGSTVTANYDDGSSETVTADSYASSDESVATVDDGVVSAEGEGDATITAEYQGESAEASVSVDDPLQSLDLGLAESELEVGDTTGSTVTATYASGDQEVTADAYTSSDESVATVDDSGVVTAEGEGEATITAEYDGETADATVNVSEPVELESIDISLDETELVVGDTTGSTVTATYTDGSTAEVTADAYGSSDDTVATVDDSGVVTAEGEGSATIAAEYQGETAETSVTVDDPIESITLELTDTELSIDDTASSTVTATYASDATEDVTADATYSSSDSDVATVDDSGQVTAEGEGSATITAEYQGETATADVSVSDQLESITLELDQNELGIDETTDSTVTAEYASGATEEVTADATYSSSDSAVATVDDSGQVTAVGSGSAEITAEYESLSDTASVSVAVELESIELALDESDLVVNDTTDSTVTATYTDDSTAEVTAEATLSSSDDAVATVSGDGVVTAEGEGEATITAEYQGESATADVTVDDPLESITLELDQTELGIDDTASSTVTAEYASGATEEVTADATFSSSDSDVATVDDSGEVTAVGSGSAEITAEYESLSDTASVSVAVELESIDLALDENELVVDDTTGSTVTATYTDDSTSEVTADATFSSSNDAVATVDDSGQVTAEGEGSATITAEYQGESATADVSVDDPLESITLELGDTALDVNDETDATVTAERASGATEDVTSAADITSTDTAVATVAGATVTAEGAGSADIEAAYEGLTDSVSISVEDPVVNVDLALDATELEVDQTTSSTVTATYASGDTAEVTADATYSSNDSAVATVDDSGVVTAEGAGDATITAEYQNESDTATVTVTEAAPQYQSFTAFVDGEYMQLGQGDEADTFDLDQCPEGQPVAEECSWFMGEATENGTFTVASDDLSFAETETFSNTLGQNVSIVISAPNGLEVTPDFETGEMTFEGTLDIEIPEFTSVLGTESCGFEVDVAGTTGDSGDVSGEPLALDEDGTGTATIVDGTFEVGNVPESRCPGLAGSIENEINLPSPSGENEATLGMYFEFYENELPEYDVEITDTNAPVTPGETITVDAEVTNVGGAGTQQVALNVDEAMAADRTRDSQNVALDAGESTTVTLEWDTSEQTRQFDGQSISPIETGTYTTVVTSADDNASTSVSIESAGPETPTSFTAVGQEGTLELGTSDDNYDPEEDPITLPACTQYEQDEEEEHGEDPSVTWWEEDTCFEIDVSEENLDYQNETFAEWEATGDDITFPWIRTTAASSPAHVQMGAPDGMNGTVNFETGAMTATAQFQIEVGIYPAQNWEGDPTSECTTSTEVQVTSGESGELTGTPLTFDVANETATGTLVENQMTVPEFEGGFLCSGANNSYYLPADQVGENYFTYEFWIDMEGLN